MRNGFHALTISSVLLTAGVAHVAAQDQRDVFGEVIDVRVVNLETVVTDRAGNRVRGLTRDDFRLTVDGREVPIDYFSEVRDGEILPEGTSATAANDRPAEANAELEKRHTNFLIFIDDYFSIGAQRNLVLARLDEQLARIGDADRVAIMSFDGTDVELLADWTSSKPDLRAALAAAAKRKAKGAFRLAERRVFNNNFSQQEAYVRLVAEQLDNLTVAASAAMRASVPASGRKALVLLSGGWPYELAVYDEQTGTNTLRSGAAASQRFFSNSESRNEGFMAQREQFGRNLWSYSLGTGIYQTLADTANLLGYTIYPVDVPGLGGSGPGVGADAPRPEGAIGPPGESNLEATLRFLAAETGGKAMLNSNRLTALERALDDTGSYYWLGFTSNRRADNRRHRIRLEAREPGFKVRTRSDYVDFSRQVEVEMMVEGALLFQAEVEHSDFDIRVGDPKRLERRKMEVPIQLAIPTAALTHLYNGGEYVAMMTVTLAVKDKRDTLSNVATMPFQTSRREPPGVEDLVTYDMNVELWREPHDLVVMVQDLATGNVLSSSVRVRPR